MLLKTTSMPAPRGGWTLLLGLVLAGLTACTQGKPQRKVVGEFVGSFDATSGRLTMASPVAGLPPGVLAVFGPIDEDHNGTPGTSTSPNTVELVTEGSLRFGPGCGRASSVCADVTVRSFYPASELHNVFVEIQTMDPVSGNLGFWNTAIPTAGQPGEGAVTSANGGLWRYPALLDWTRGTTSAVGANAATRTWYFDNLANTSFTFRGRVMADVVSTVTTPPESGLKANCGGTPTLLSSIGNCGECGRTSDGTACGYANLDGGSPAASHLAFTVSCTTGQACDTGDSMAFACKDLQSDAANCGVCGNACGAGNTCSAGACTTGFLCTAPATKCGAACCPAGSSCTAGLCILDDATAVAVGAQHACATTTTTRLPTLANTGTPSVVNNVVCWGKSWWPGTLQPGGIVAPNWTRAFTVPEFNDPGSAIPASQVHLSAGGTFSSATSGGTVWSWGTLWTGNTNGVDGTGQSPNATATGGGHLCSMLATSVWCWGDNAAGQLGNGTTSGGDAFQPHVVPVDGTSDDNGPFGSFLVATQISAAGDTTCAVLGAPVDGAHGAGQTAGTVACWGNNDVGQAGGTPASPASFTAPHLLPGIDGLTAATTATAVSVGGRHAVALLADGGLAFWGKNDHGQYGNGTTADGSLVTFVTPAHGPATAVAAGQDFTCYLGGGGDVWCSGVNAAGQLGDGTTAQRLSPVQVLGVTGASVVSAGGVPRTGNPALGGACALKGGNVYCWGDDTTGQVGAGTSGGFYATAQLVQMTPLAPPAAPTGVGAAATAVGQVTVSWTAVAGATSYNLYWSTSSAVSKSNGTKVTGATSGGTVDSLQSGTPLFFVVTAVTSVGESVDSSPAATATPL